MGADVGIEHEDCPETNQRQGVAEQWYATGNGYHKIGDAHGEGCKEKADDSVSVEPGEYPVGHSRDGAGSRIPDGVSEKIDEKREDQGPERIPHGDIEQLLLAGGNCLEEVEEGDGEGQKDHHIHGPYPFGVLAALGVTEGECHGPCRNGQVPDPQGETGGCNAVKGRPHESWHEVMDGADQSGADEAENHHVGMDRPEPAEDEPGDIPIEGEVGGDHRRS